MSSSAVCIASRLQRWTTAQDKPIDSSAPDNYLEIDNGAKQPSSQPSCFCQPGACFMYQTQHPHSPKQQVQSKLSINSSTTIISAQLGSSALNFQGIFTSTTNPPHLHLRTQHLAHTITPLPNLQRPPPNPAQLNLPVPRPRPRQRNDAVQQRREPRQLPRGMRPLPQLDARPHVAHPDTAAAGRSSSAKGAAVVVGDDEVADAREPQLGHLLRRGVFHVFLPDAARLDLEDPGLWDGSVVWGPWEDGDLGRRWLGGG